MSKSTRIEMTVQEWAEQFSAPVIVEIIQLLRAEEYNLGPKGKNELVGTFLAGYIGAVMFESLMSTQNRSLSKEQRLNITMKEFADTKARMAEAIATGFTTAMSNFTGRQVDYYCHIKALPEPLNKLPS